MAEKTGELVPVVVPPPSPEAFRRLAATPALEPIYVPSMLREIPSRFEATPGPEEPPQEQSREPQRISIPVVDLTLPEFAELTEEEEEALFQLVLAQTVRRQGPNSAELLEELPGLEEEVSSRAVARRKRPVPAESGEEISSAAAPELGQVTSPGEALEVRPRAFWFNINAELVVYGATEPDARVEICGRRIRLRPDGTFSYRFALPDGRYELPAVAVSRDGMDRRSARLEFSRSTEYQGDVGCHPQDPALKGPAAENVS
jgi:hypothetical protein